MIRGALGLFIILVILLFFAPVAADVSLPPWSWNTYTGNNTWQVTTTETGCGEGAITDQYTVTIQFNGATATMGDVGHGPADGTFISGNILHIPGRTVADPPGRSTLSAYDVFFTTDCSAFAAKYDWDYAGPDGACSGTTTLNGQNGNGCPASQAVPAVPTVAPASGGSVSSELATARSDLIDDLTQREMRDITNSLLNAHMITEAGAQRLNAGSDQAIAAAETKLDGQYQAILGKDPTNFYANMDMAELRKSQGRLDDYIRYVNAALSNPDVAAGTADAVRKDIMAKNNLATWPTPENSIVIATLGPDARTAAQSVYGMDMQKDVTGNSVIDNLRYLFTWGGSRDLVTTVALPGGGQ